ncbi:MAG: MotA/TolQ/ExbB proton channel family protein [Bacteroidetes bacterium]|nr:MotA/TolQ/ExbB proton channel family protein [Bacteroidota bacterium]MCL2303473.1 MotA/TolQ/ExbB proton channel family protein [Lentimicrobiaceae bacterium]
MKKLIALFAVAGFLTFGMTQNSFAQNDQTAEESAQIEQTEQAALIEDSDDQVQQSLHFVLKDKFIEGTALWMSPILICMIIGLAFIIERIFYLNLATVNSKKLLSKLDEALKAGGIEKAKQVCRDTKGPLAGVFYQGLERADEGLDSVEKALVAYGSVQIGKLESNLSWISLFIAIVPMIGFLGTVVGMVLAFDDIERAGDISPTIVAGGMKLALITTVFALITAVILQVFYNYIISKIDAIVVDMEDATISFMDMMIRNK